MTAPTAVPVGFRLRMDAGTRRHDGGRLLLGGSPRRALRLTDEGASIAARLLDGAPVHAGVEAALARRLLDTGIAHPVPPASPALAIEVVVPVYDDSVGLARCLTALGDELTVTVVDDGSPDAAAIAAVCARHGARLVRRETNGGPAAARNAGAARGTCDVVAFVDADAVTDVSTLRRVAAHLRDPLVAAAAPRVRPATGGQGPLAAFADASSPLDLGPVASTVAPTRRVAYVPSTVLVVGRSALCEVGGFDEALRYGEDVDLVWRLAAAGWSVRYEPDAQVHHAEPTSWRRWLRRRYAYGTSAGWLAQRHGGGAATLVVQPAPAVAVAVAVAGAPALGAGVAVLTAWRLHRRLRAADVPAVDAAKAAAAAPMTTALAASRWATQLWWPVLVVAARSRRGRPAAIAALAAPPLVGWVQRRPALDPLRWTLGVWADDAAYGAGVWRGCLAARTTRPLRPRAARRR